MAVQARRLNLLPHQLMGNREITNPVDGNGVFYSTQIGYGGGAPGTTAAAANLLPMYGGSVVKSNNGGIGSRKRSRIETLMVNPFVQIQNQQIDIDRLVSQHIERLRIEIGEKRNNQARRVLELLEERFGKKLREKDEEIEMIVKLNWALEEKIKSLFVETQIWRDLAHTNEATANGLRAHLDKVLAHQVIGSDEDCESCCGSSESFSGKDGGSGEWRAVFGGGERRCRNCGKEESCVLLLPCRHLCLCTVCGSTLHTCPVCKSDKNASVHVNMS